MHYTTKIAWGRKSFRCRRCNDARIVVTMDVRKYTKYSAWATNARDAREQTTRERARVERVLREHDATHTTRAN